MFNISIAKKKKWFDEITKNFSKVEFHFALEGTKGKGKLFLNNCLKELNMFEKTDIIESSEIKWTALYKMMKNQKK